jgi:hypothetical protein
LGAQLILPKPNPSRAYVDTRLSLQESHVWRRRTNVHAFSKHLAQVDGFYCVHYIYSLLYQLFLCCLNTVNPIFFRLKVNHIRSCNSCAFILVLDVDAISIFFIIYFINYYEATFPWDKAPFTNEIYKVQIVLFVN